MKKNNTQRGSAHGFIIIVLIAIICGALGVVFYQNFIAKQTVNEQTSKTQGTSEETDKVTQFAFNSTIYELTHPKNWTASSKAASDTKLPGVVFTVENPDKTVRVVMHLFDTVTAVACDPVDGLKVSFYNVHTKPAVDLADKPLYLVETISDHIGGGYEYKIGLTEEGGDTHSAIGESHCNVARVGIASSARVAADTKLLVQPSITATIEFPKLLKATDIAIKEMQPIRDMIGSGDYEVAAKVIESARKK